MSPSPYRTESELHGIARAAHKAQAWSFRGKLRSVRVGDQTYKRRFMPPRDEQRFLEEVRSVGITGTPASYADVFHRLFAFPTPDTSVAASLAAPTAGPWIEGLRPGKHPGRWKVMDLVSAYGWSALTANGLPETWSARPSYKPEPGGIYAVRLPNRQRALATFEEIDSGRVTIRRVLSGVVFRKWRPLDRELGLIRKRFTDWKRIYRSWWGRYAADTPVTCQSLRYGVPVKEWQLVPRQQNRAWVHLILGRVRHRLEDDMGSVACSVMVDAATVPYTWPVKVGSEIGDWKQKQTVINPEIRGCRRVAA